MRDLEFSQLIGLLREKNSGLLLRLIEVLPLVCFLANTEILVYYKLKTDDTLRSIEVEVSLNVFQKQRARPKTCSKSIKLVAWDRIELPTRGFSVFNVLFFKFEGVCKCLILLVFFFL
jgi:hypothetical protein